jgi:hypothetical protein
MGLCKSLDGFWGERFIRYQKKSVGDSKNRARERVQKFKGSKAPIYNPLNPFERFITSEQNSTNARFSYIDLEL